MKLKICLFFFIVSLVNTFGVTSQSAADENNKIIAVVDKDYKITFNELSQYVVDWLYYRKYPNKSEAYDKALNAMVTNQLKRIDFFETGLNKNQDLIESIRRIINEELIVEFYNKQFVNKYTNEKAAAEAYKKMDKEVFYKEVVLPIPANATKNQIDSVKTLAYRIENEFKHIDDISKFAKKFSLKTEQDAATKTTGWEQSLADPVAGTAYSLEKGSTKVLEFNGDYYIIKMVDSKKVNLEPFDKIKSEIMSKLKNSNFATYDEKYQDYKKSFVDDSSLQWNQNALERILQWSQIRGFYNGIYKDTINNILAKGDDFNILTYNNGKVDLKEFLRLLNDVLVIDSREKIRLDNIKDFILEAVRSDYIIKEAQKLDLEKNIFNANTKNEVLKGRIVYLYNQANIEQKIPEATEDALRQFYNERKDSTYYQLKKINIYAKIYSDSTEAADVMQKIKNGAKFKDVSNKWYVKTYVRERDGTYESYLSKEPPYLAQAAFKLGLNEVAGPIVFYDDQKNKRFAIIKCVAVRPEKQLTYDDAKDKVINDYKNYYRRLLEDETEAKLKEKYGVKIFEDVLASNLSHVK